MCAGLVGGLLALMIEALGAQAQPEPAPPAAETASEASPEPDAVPAAPDEADEDAAAVDSPGEAEKETPADAPPKRFYEQEPYDVITLDAANDNFVLKVMPLPLPDRKRPEPSKRVGRLMVRPFDRREEEYQIMWRNIARIDLFEELVLRETEQIVMRAAQRGRAGEATQSQKAFDEAYDHFQWLLRFHPGVEGLDKALQDYLYLNSATLFLNAMRYASEAGDEAPAVPLNQRAYQGFAQAFAILEELYARNPDYSYGATTTVTAAMERVGDRLIGWYAGQGDFVSARHLLVRLSRQYRDRLQIAQTWRERLMAEAAEKRDAAADHLAGERFVEAHDASREMMKIWPQIEGGRDLVLEIARQYPLIVVGVSQPALELDPASMDNFASWRAGQLVHPTLLEYRERGPEGGRYASPFGTVKQSDDRTGLIFDLRSAPGQPVFTGYDLSSNLLAIADPGSPRYDPSWASLMGGLQVEEVMRVRVSLRRPHVLPQSILRIPFRMGDHIAERYAVDHPGEGEARFQPAGEANPGRPRPVVVERFYDNPRETVEALRKGQIDMIDRLLPADVPRLRQESGIEVGSYAFPTLFVLEPNRDNPYLANRTFRRALVYAINREVILNRGLLNGQRVAGSRVISAPLPAGINPNDLSAYAYDERIAPYSYDPVMAAILMGLASQQLAAVADQRQEPAPELDELVLAHPFGELGRFVARQIQMQLAVVDVACTLRELPPGHSRVAEGPWDLRLMEIRMPEPLVDLPRLLGQDGVAPAADPYVGLALRQLDASENWKTARQHLFELHRQLHNDVTLIPLWQLTEHFARHSGVRGVPDAPIFFYHDIDNWQIIPPEQQD